MIYVHEIVITLILMDLADTYNAKCYLYVGYAKIIIHCSEVINRQFVCIFRQFLPYSFIDSCHYEEHKI